MEDRIYYHTYSLMCSSHGFMLGNVSQSVATVKKNCAIKYQKRKMDLHSYKSIAIRAMTTNIAETVVTGALLKQSSVGKMLQAPKSPLPPEVFGVIH